MKSLQGIILLVCCLLIYGCSPDPCLIADNIECPTGDNDGDGVLNGEDDDPLDACVPNLPTFEENIIGIWSCSGLSSGKIKINDDGTYEDLQSELLPNGVVFSKRWFLVIRKIKFEAENINGFTAHYNLPWDEYSCSEVILNADTFCSLVLTREE